MPGEFRFLVDAGIPFVMEKPWGLDAKTVNELADHAESKKAWVSYSAPTRYTTFSDTFIAMRKKGRTFSYIEQEIGINRNVITRELNARGIPTGPVKADRRAKRGRGFWRSFD